MAKKPKISSFTELYEHTVSGNSLLNAFLPGHLAIEFLLRKLIIRYDENLENFVDQLNHARLVQLGFDLGLLSPDQREVLVAINTTRNKLAHQITFQPSLRELKALWSKASNAFSDLTDGISQGIEQLKLVSSIDEIDEWVFAELFVQICYDLHSEYVEGGGDWDEF